MKMESNSNLNFVGMNVTSGAGGQQFVVNPPLPPRISFVNEVQSMLFAFGDNRNPNPETASLVEEICQQQMSEIVTRASEIAQARGASEIGIEDLLFLMRRSPVKIQRLIQYMSVMEVVSSVKKAGGNNVTHFESGKRVRRCREFLSRIDTDSSGVLSRAACDQLPDECRLDRLRRLDRLSRDMDERRYAEFTRARQVSFLGHHMKLSQNFQDWITQDIPDEIDILPLDRTALEGLAYLAYETVGQLVDICLQVRHDQTTSDPILRQMAPLVYNSMYQPQVSDHIVDEKHESESSYSRPIEPRHVTEAMRRLGQMPPAMGRISKAARPKLMQLIAI